MSEANDTTTDETTGDPTPEWVTARMVEDEQEAQLIVGFLKAQDIPCQLESRYSHEFPSHMGELGEVEIKVPSEHLAAARAALELRDASSPEGDEEYEEA